MKWPMFYFNWLQKDNPTGLPDRLPELKNNFETSVPGLYCIGDLTGIPLIKLAAESGYDLIERIAADKAFKAARGAKPAEVHDLIIIGAGPAGVSACLHAAELGFDHLLIESSTVYKTIRDFPAGKPIYVTPQEPPMRSALAFGDGNKESLLGELQAAIENKTLPLREDEPVKRIVQAADGFTVETEKGSYRALRVIVAIGKNGNPRRLGVPGETLPHVFNRLIDPTEFHEKSLLVVGGGDSAVEAAVALAQSGNQVYFSYRKRELSRPKEQNLQAFEQLVREKRILPFFESQVKAITANDVLLQTGDGEERIPAESVFILAGSEFPLAFFARSQIRMEGERQTADWVKIAAALLFAGILYFGKKAPDTPVAGVLDALRLPLAFLQMPWPKMLNGLLAWLCLPLLAGCAVYLAGHMMRQWDRYFQTAWNRFKYGYFAAMLLLFPGLYVAYKWLNLRPVFGDMGDWYTAAYSLTIVLFGFGRMYRNPTGYIKRQTTALMLIQVIPLFILPVIVLPLLGRYGLLNEWMMTQVFPNESYWRAYGFILAWPLFIHNLAIGEPTLFWLVFGLFQTFVLIPWMVYKWGKGAYCGWICSCGALAETLGDEYRTLAPHGPTAKKWDNAGQVVLWFAGLITVLAWMAGSDGGAISRFFKDLYNILVDIIFAGVLGVGVYFVLSGRVWCRFLCPLAALMHIYARFSVYRIMADKKRCISCNICTKVCHMGIDVMNYANKGIPMNDVECVRCSACVVNCPMQVLTFGRVSGVDLDNQRYKHENIPLTPGWQSGLPQADIERLLEAQHNKGK